MIFNVLDFLKEVMKQTNASVFDVSKSTLISETSIRRFLRTGKITRVYEAALKRWAEERSKMLNAS